MTSPTPAESAFDRETAVAVAPDADPGRPTWTASLSDAWNIGDNPNGGYLLSPMVQAIRSHTGRPDPLSLTAHFLRPGLGGQPADIVAEEVRSGRRSATVTASLHQGGKERVRVLGAFGDLANVAPLGLDVPELGAEPPELPTPDECRDRRRLEQGVELPILSRLDVRIDPQWAEPGRGGRAEVAGWIRFADGRAPDAVSLPLFADAFPPSLFSLVGRVGWVPTLELTVHVRRPPAPGWIRARFRTSDLVGELFVEDGELWDSTGQLVARSRQLAVLLDDGR